jgi:4a-hydroxytetrahydrobiopterin dehydratase
MQPGPERPAVVKAAERREGALEAVCSHVVRERASPGDRVGRTPRITPVTAEERSGCLSVAAARLPNEISVTWFTHSFAVLYEQRALASPATRNTSGMSDWQEQGDALVREFELPSFQAAIAFVDRLAELAESKNHHPDIDIRYRRVTVRWTTHSEGGITDKDREMAERTSALAVA